MEKIHCQICGKAFFTSITKDRVNLSTNKIQKDFASHYCSVQCEREAILQLESK